MIETVSWFVFNGGIGVSLFLIMSEVSMETRYKGPIIGKFLFAEFDGIHRYMDFELIQGVLSYPQVESILVFCFGLPDDSIDKNDPWKIIIDDPTIDNSFAKFLDSEADRHIWKKSMDPIDDVLPGRLTAMSR